MQIVTVYCLTLFGMKNKVSLHAHLGAQCSPGNHRRRTGVFVVNEGRDKVKQGDRSSTVTKLVAALQCGTSVTM